MDIIESLPRSTRWRPALAAIVATASAFASADGLELVGDTLVKTGSGSAEISAAEIGSLSVRVEGGTLRIAQAAKTSARYIRFRAKTPNPWRTQNAGSLWEMNSFQLVNGGSLVDYPSGTTVANLGTVSQESTPSNILTWDGSQNGDWQVVSDDPGFVIDMGENVTFDGYAIAGAVISTGRSPYAFDVEVGVDDGAGGVEWCLFDSRSQFCTCGYGADWFTSANGYAPRMPPVYAGNPLPAFVADASVSVAAGATLELVGVSGRLPNLSGAGRVVLASSRPELTGDCTFTGSFDGAGTLAFAMDGETVGAFSFDTTAIPVTNAGRERTFTVAGGATAAKLPLVFDSADAPLNLTLSGAVATPKTPILRDRFGNEVAFIRHGLTTYSGATVSFLDEAPVAARHVRFTPISGLDVSDALQADGIDFFLGGEPVAFSDIQITWLDCYRTTNYTSGVLSDQIAQSYVKPDSNRHANLFDRDSATYYQYNRVPSTFGDDAALDNAPALTVTFATAKTFDSFELWQPTYAVCSNPAYWIGQWLIETSLDGNVWMTVSDQSSEKVAQSKLYTGWPPVVTAPVDSGAIPRSGEWFSADSFEVSGDVTIAEEPRYLRILITELSKAGGETNGTSSFIDIGELEVHKNGAKVAWPAGTTVSCTDGSDVDVSGLVNAPVAMPNDEWNGYDANKAADGGDDASNARRAIWDPGYAVLRQGAGFVIAMPSAIEFDSYKIYAGDNWDGNYRSPSKWTFDVSCDGVSWTTLDTADREDGFTVPSKWMPFQHYATRSVDWSGLGRYASNRFQDDAGLSIADGATLSISNATETVGALYGEGSIRLQDAVLTVSGGDSRFSGAIVGEDGVLVIDGGTFVAQKADFRGLGTIRLVNGATLSGTAFYGDTPVIDVGAGCTNALRPARKSLVIFLK